MTQSGKSGMHPCSSLGCAEQAIGTMAYPCQDPNPLTLALCDYHQQLFDRLPLDEEHCAAIRQEAAEEAAAGGGR